MTDRNSQRSQAAVRFGQVHTLDRLWPVALGAQVLVQLQEEGVRARAIDDVLTRHPIPAGGAFVLEHQPPRGRQHVEPVDPVIQGVEPELRLLLGLLTDFPLSSETFGGSSTPDLTSGGAGGGGFVVGGLPRSSVVGRVSK